MRSRELTAGLMGLRRDVAGEVLTPGDDGYDSARGIFYGGIDPRPAALVRVTGAEDVATVLRQTAGEADVAVRSGGHSVAGHSSVDGGVVIDLRELTDIDIDLPGGTVWAGAGATAAELTGRLGQDGRAVGFGDTGSVGIGGITLGGGIGFLSRKHGLTIDSLRAAEVVTVEGETLIADRDNHPDLFWALRGGGGNFGVATRFQYSLAEVDRVVGGMILLPASVESVAGFVDLSVAAPDELATIINIMPCPPMPGVPEEWIGRSVIMGLVTWCGDIDEGRRQVDRIRSLGEPLFDMIDDIPYPAIYQPEDDEYHPTAIARTGFADEIDERLVATMLDEISRSDASLRVVQIRAMGGTISRVPADATAFGHRDRGFLVNVAAFYEGAADRARREKWVRDLAKVVTGGDDAGYIGFIGDEGPERIRAAYPGDLWDRLRHIKTKYDPGNRLRHNVNIPPLGEGAIR